MKLHRQPSPNASTINLRKLVQAAVMTGRGLPVETIAERLEVNAKALRTELNRHGIDRRPNDHLEADPNLTLQMRLSREERVTLGTAALDFHLYEPSAAAVLLRSVLGDRDDVARRIMEQGIR